MRPFAMTKIRSALKRAADAAEASRPGTLDETEREAIAKALRTADGNLSEAAKLLGITRQSLYRRMEKFGLK